MSWETVTAFNLILLAAIASPGAAFLLSVKTTLSAGRAAGIATGLGLATMASLWTLAALLGLESLFALFPWAYSSIKVAGACYLLYLAVQTWRHARAPLNAAPTPRHRAFLTGLLVNLGNPKSMLFAAAVIVVIFPKGLSTYEITLITANHFLLEVCCYSAFALALSGGRARSAYLSVKPAIDRVAASLLGALGLRLLLEK